MPLTLEQYVEKLAARTDLPWPTAPIDPPKAKPKIKEMPVKAVFWTVYGTLVAIPQGELQYEHPQDFVTAACLEKLIKEFKMWNSMSRKPGAPSEYMKELFDKALSTLRLTTGGHGEKFPELQAERVWDDIVKKLQQKEYKFDAATYGSLDDFTKKIAYFYHASIQGTGAYPGATDALKLLSDRVVQGLLADGQCFTVLQLQRCLKQQDPDFDLGAVIAPAMRIISVEKKARKPSDTLFKAAAAAAGAKGISPSEILHVGSSLTRDIAPAKKHGFRTALFAGDKASLSATAEQLQDPATRPDAMITELPQVLELIS